MTLNKIRKNTLIILLCCVVVIGSVGISSAANWKFWKEPWFVKAWNVITGMKDTLEGMDALISAMTLEMEEAGDKIVDIKERKKSLLKRRNAYAERNVPNEQEKTRARNAMNAAAEKHNIALSEANTLREDIAELEAELKLTYYSDARYGIIETTIEEKKAYLAQAKFVMETEDAKYKAAKKAYRKVIYSLSYTVNRDTISRLTYQINSCDDQIEALEDKIEKLKQDILDEQERRRQLDIDIKAEEDKFNKLIEEGKKPGPQI